MTQLKPKYPSRPYLLLLGLVLLLFSCKADQPQINEDTLAVVENRLIKAEDFIERYREFRRRTGEGVYDTFEARRQVFNTQVEEKILIIEAEKRGLDKDTEARHERRRIEMQELLNAFNRNLIASRVEVTDDELKGLFVRLNTKIKARHLFAEKRETADSLFAAVQSGASFEQLAKTAFRDPKLRQSGGSLGYFTVDEMEPSFEDAAFKLEVGEISPPVRTSDGYSIIMVEDRITQPLLTEFEYAKHRSKLHGYWKTRKIKRAMRSYVDSLSHTLDVSFNVPIIKELYASLRKKRHKKNPSEDSFNLLNMAHLRNKQLVQSKVGAWDVATFQEKSQFTSAGQHNWIRGPEHLQDFVSGLIAREAILKKAKAANLHKTPEYSKKVSEKWDSYLLTRIEAEMRDSMVVPEDSLRSYYDEDPKRFSAPPEINVKEIVVRERELAEKIARKLEQGASFEELARTYSIRDWSAKRGGELGFLTPKDFGHRARKVFALEVGERAGPIQMDSTYMLLECIEKKPARILSFNEACADVENTVRYLSWDAYRSSQISQFRKSLDHLKVLPQRLIEIRLTKADRSKS